MQFGGQPTPWSEVEIEGLRLRSVSQILIQEIGAAGPENAEDSARRACGVIQRQADQIVSADARIAELEAEVSGLRVDAERWRKLRGMHWSKEDDFTVTRGRSVKLGFLAYSGEQLDAAIDAARANGGEG